jgi:hypothetical protein
VKCQNKSDQQYCPDHQHKYHYEKPDDCPVCMELISSRTETPLECGHWIHKQCLIPTNIHICPVCRQSMKQHEVDYIFGENHHQVNQYGQNYFQSFVSDSLFFQPIIIQGASGYGMMNIGDFNNQEHFFNENQSEYLFEDENHNGLEFHDDFDDYNDLNRDNFYHEPHGNIVSFSPHSVEDRIQRHDHDEMPELIHVDDEENLLNQSQFNSLNQQISGTDVSQQNIPNFNLNLQSPFISMADELIEMIIQEIEIRPRFNPYVTLPNNMNEIPDNMRHNFIEFVDRLINNFDTFENHNIDEIMRDEIRARLFASESDINLLRIDFNMIFVPHVNINYHIRLSNLINSRIRTIFNDLTFDN